MNRSERRRLDKQRRRGKAAGGVSAPGDDAFIGVALNEAREHLRAGRAREALTIYRRVIKIDGRNAQALNLAGVAYFQLGDQRRALKHLRQAVAGGTADVDAHNNLGNVLKAAGRLDEAETAYRRALEIRPDYADAHYNLGILLEAMGRPAEAEAAYRNALDATPGFVLARFNRANTLKALGRLDDAIADYQAAIVAAPDLAQAHNNLGSALHELGRSDEAVAAYRRAIEIAPEFADAHYNMGIALQPQAQLDDAVAAYRRAIEINTGQVGARVNLGVALQRLGRLDEAIAAYRAACAAAPGYAGGHINLADALLETGDVDAALAVADGFLADQPADSGMLAFKALLLNEAGQADAAEALIGIETFFRGLPIAAPEGYADVAGFNAALADHVLAHPSLAVAPASHATRAGRHSGELLVEPIGPMAAFEGVVRAAVDGYIRALPGQSGHPFAARPPRRYGLNVWGVVLEGQGHQVPHIHPAAWLSGVYYVRLPEAIGAADDGAAGWIAFGRPPAHFHLAAAPKITPVRPEEGLMLLFPSYLYHHTIPFESVGARISIAFDVLPTA